MAVLRFSRDLFTEGHLKILKGSKTHNFGGIGPGAEVNTTVTVTGAKAGDYVIGFSLSNPAPTDHASTIWDAQVTAANTVTVKITNAHAANTVTYTSSTLRVLVLQEV